MTSTFLHSLYERSAPCNALLLPFVLACTLVSTAAYSQTYTTTFDGDENPLSENGKWVHNGLDWAKTRKGGGIAYGTQTGTKKGLARYDDSYAHLAGFPPDQEAWGEVRISKPDPSCYQELEILLRWNSSEHSTTGYECFARCLKGESAYLNIVRWEGPLGKFTYLVQKRGAEYGLKNGDILKASIIGNVITLYVNGVEKARVKDGTHKTGNPGIGIYLECPNGHGVGSNGDYGFKSFTARGTNSAPTTSLAGVPSAAGPVRVEIRKEGDKFRLYRGGEPYFIRGAVYFGDPKGKFPMRDIAGRGGNSVRSGGSPILDEAQRLGMTVTVGLPMRMEWADKFDYNDEQAVRRQFEQMKKRVLELKDHPAVLLWGIGNELSVRYKNMKVWDAVNEVARMIHEVDPNHPAMTVIGEADRDVVREIMKRCPDLDLLGVNNYQGVETVPTKLREAGWDKPYAITEWGPSGDWQVPRTKWGASIEETSTEKAQRYLERYQNTMLKDTERCLGSYAFIWMSRHERTPTWYGMFLESGERTEAVNAMQFLWTGKWPSNRAPRVAPPRIDGRAARDNVYLKPGSPHTATVHVEDPDGDRWTCRWEIMAEVTRAGYAGRGERRSQPMPELIQEARGGELTFTAPKATGAYRAFVFVVDGQGNGATANIPFYVSAD